MLICGYDIRIYFLLFMIYAILGWIMEVTCKLIQYKRFINRGFLIGPYCPIYGYGALLITILLHKYTNDPIVLFIMAIVVCGTLEYLTSYFMEKIYNVRWWDYSNKKFNINGRICLETMIPFGLLASLIIYVLHPAVIKLVDKLSPTALLVVAITLFIIYIIDNVISTYILFKIKGKIKSERKDNTEKIKQYIEKWFQENTVLYRRIKSAFPKLQVFIKEIEMRKKGKEKHES